MPRPNPSNQASIPYDADPAQEQGLMRRDDLLDIAKGVLMCLLVVGHISSHLLAQRGLSPSKIYDAGGVDDCAWIIFRNLIGFGLSTLFIISGYLLAQNYEKRPFSGLREFYSRRLKRLYLPYVTWFLAYLLIWEDPNVIIITVSFIFLDGWFHFWYIWVIFIAYLLFPALYPMVKDHFRPTMALFVILIALSVYLEKYTLPSYTLNYLFHDKLLILPLNLLYFSLGIKVYLSGKDAKAINFKDKRMLALLVSGLIITFSVKLLVPNPGIVNAVTFAKEFNILIFDLITTVFFFKFLGLIMKMGSGVKRMLAVMGIASYGIYLSHMLVLYFWGNVFNAGFPTVSSAHALLTIAASTACLYLLARIQMNSRIRAITGF